MQLYITTLNWFACFWHKSERVWKWLLIMFGYRGLVEALISYKERDMLERMELLVKNIDKCRSYRELKACEMLLHTTLLYPYPEYTSTYYSIVTNALWRKEQQLKSLNN